MPSSDLPNANAATVQDGAPSGRRYDRAAFALLLLFTVFRLIYGTRLGLAQDEAHYWQWSRHPALSYYDQGPGIAWCIRLGTLLFGDTPLGVRFVTVLLAGATGWLAYRTAALWAGARAGMATLVLLSVAPLFAAGSLLATYDVPQVFFWTAALYAVTRTVQSGRAAGWYAVGALVGLGALCKVTMLLFAPCVLFFLLSSPAYRRWLATPHPYAAFALALALFAPVVVWNAGHDWVNLKHATALTGRTRHAPPLRWFGDFLGGQAALLGPFLFLAELFALARMAKPLPGLHEDARRFAAAFGAPVLILCLAMSLRSPLEANWPVPTHIAALMAVSGWLSAVPWRTHAARRAALALLIVPGALLSLLIFFPDALPAAGIHPTAKAAAKLNEPYGWERIAARVQAERDALAREGNPVFVAGPNYRVNSILAFYLPDRPETQALYLGKRRDQYWFWTDPARLVGQNAVLVFSERDEASAAIARPLFDSMEEAAPAIVTRPGFVGTVKEWHIYRCRGFRGYDPAQYAVGY